MPQIERVAYEADADDDWKAEDAAVDPRVRLPGADEEDRARDRHRRADAGERRASIERADRERNQSDAAPRLDFGGRRAGARRIVLAQRDRGPGHQFPPPGEWEIERRDRPGADERDVQHE